MVDNNDATSTKAVLYVVVVVVAVLVATVLAPVVWNATRGSGDTERSSVAVVTLSGGVNDANVNAIAKDLREARNNESIDAVVLRIDSPGGGVAPSEEFYLAVNRTAQEMPVVAYVEGIAASGGYYGIAPSDAIFVKPSSQVGSIGVIVSAPLSSLEQAAEQSKTYLRSGPDKATYDVDGYREDLERLQNSFVNTVMRHRGDELDISRETVMNAKAYMGTEAVKNGFADRIGSLQSAIQYAAGEAGDIEGDKYDVVYKEPPQTTTGIVLSKGDLEKVDGNVVYVDRSDGKTEFVKPVRFYAVWGVPQDLVEDEEVTTNESK
ncbi:MAG: S49 family peptidase [Haloarculaceae archaeon]